ncbi:MAG: CBS domain-containing protein, partial [Halobacteriovoraceae bacterium]|nr:CBS domain-containing protein [Halobacteriovoraceae bacterium]
IATEMKYYNSHPGKIVDYMSKAVLTIKTTASIFDAIELFTKNSFHCYPVVERGKIVGAVDRRTVLSVVNKLGQTTWYKRG